MKPILHLSADTKQLLLIGSMFLAVSLPFLIERTLTHPIHGAHIAQNIQSP